MVRMSLRVSGMNCSHCENSVKKAVSALAGVTEVNVSLKKKTVEVVFEGSLTKEAIVNAIEEQGYVVAK